MGLIQSLKNKRVYFDTNIIIYLIEGFPEYQKSVDEIQEVLETSQCVAITSDITICESLIKPFKDNYLEGVKIFQSFLEESGIFELIPTARSTYIKASLVSATQSLKLPDAIHVATAIQSRCDIFLTNDKSIKTPNSITKLSL